MNVNIYLRIVTQEETNQFLIFLDEKGDMPKFSLSRDIPINRQIFDKLSEYHLQDVNMLFSTKQVSSISNNSDILDIFYNFIATSTRSKTGSFVKYNQQSLELHRLMNNQS